MSHKLDYCDLIAYRSLIKAVYNNHEPVYTLFFVIIPKNLINAFHMFLQK